MIDWQVIMSKSDQCGDVGCQKLSPLFLLICSFFCASKMIRTLRFPTQKKQIGRKTRTGSPTGNTLNYSLQSYFKLVALPY